MQIRHVKSIAGTKVHKAALLALHELVQTGAARGDTMPFNYDDPAFYFVTPDKGEIVGVLAYRPSEWNKDIWVCLGWVREDYRRRGIYRAMYMKLQGLRDEKFPDYTISGGVTIDNNATMSKVMNALGRKCVVLVYRDEPDQLTIVADIKP